jgi:ribose transport system permease protein
MSRIFSSPIAGALSAMILVAIIVAATTNHFLDQGNLSNLALQVSIVAIRFRGSASAAVA